MRKEQRWNDILEIIRNHNGTIDAQELSRMLNISGATIRRDLKDMEELNMITRYHGGAMLTSSQYDEPGMIIKKSQNSDVKKRIGLTAARLIQDNQMVYLDAGSTTYEMIPYIKAKNITVVTSGVPHLSRLGEMNINTIVLGGALYWSTEAIVGRHAIEQLSELYFDIAFVGTNGINARQGYSTSNEMEAETKAMAIHHANHAYIVSDHSKFDQLRPASFATLKDAAIITDTIPDSYKDIMQYMTIHGESNMEQE